MAQWFHAWSPSGPHEAAFVFEDDIEVSSFFYRYGFVALEKYYCSNIEDKTSFQLNAHLDLLRGVRAEIGYQAGRTIPCSEGIDSILLDGPPPRRKGKKWIFDANGTVDSLNDYAQKYSGLPVMYGVCLQNQHLDAMRESSKLSIKNNNKNFLYRWMRVIMNLQFSCVSESVLYTIV